MLKRLLIPLCLLLLLAGCAAPKQEGGLTVVAAIFPEYDWARQIIGDVPGVNLRLLVDDGVDPHSYQPTVADLITVADCDLLIYGGGESDEWLADAVDSAEELILLELLGEDAHAAEYTEGMQLREEEDEADEHVWLSLRNAARFCTAIAEALCRLDSKNAERYQVNLECYLGKLNALDEAYTTMTARAQRDTILVCDRFPYRYLVEDYSLRYYAAFPGCSAESGASFATIVFLTDKAAQLELDTLLIPEGSDGRIAATVAANAGRGPMNVRVLDSMQSVSWKDAQIRTYLGTMEENLEVLRNALN